MYAIRSYYGPDSENFNIFFPFPLIPFKTNQEGDFAPDHVITSYSIHYTKLYDRVSNGISANYTEAYMRRRDPNTMVIADNLPTDKERFADRFGYEFSKLEKETMDSYNFV